MLFSQIHETQPFTMDVGGEHHEVSYVPGESNTYVFGGNSNWRGPIWLCGEYPHTLTPSHLHTLTPSQLTSSSSRLWNATSISMATTSRSSVRRGQGSR